MHVSATSQEPASSAKTNELLWDLLDRLNAGVVVASTSADVLRRNRAAQDIFHHADAVYVEHGRLIAPRPSVTARLHAALRAGDCETKFLLPRDAPGSLPVCATVYARPAVDSCVLVLLNDLQAFRTPSPDLLTTIFALTRSEAHIAVLLASGRSLRDIADTLHVSLHTARTHVRHLLLKTGTNRQVDLVRTLFRAGSAFLE